MQCGNYRGIRIGHAGQRSQIYLDLSCHLVVSFRKLGLKSVSAACSLFGRCCRRLIAQICRQITGYRIDCLTVQFQSGPAAVTDTGSGNSLAIFQGIDDRAVLSLTGDIPQIGGIFGRHILTDLREIHQCFRVSRNFLRCLGVLGLRCALISEISHIHIYRLADPVHCSPVRILPHGMCPRIRRFCRLRIGCRRILGYPDAVRSLQPFRIPFRTACQFSHGRIEHWRITPVIDFLQKSNGNIRALRIRQTILHTVRLIKALTVIGHRIGDLVFGDKICNPAGLLYRLVGCCSCGKEICAHLNAILLGFLHIVFRVRIGTDLPGLIRPVAHTDHGEINPRCGNLCPVDGALITCHIDTDRHLVCLRHAI